MVGLLGKPELDHCHVLGYQDQILTLYRQDEYY